MRPRPPAACFLSPQADRRCAARGTSECSRQSLARLAASLPGSEEEPEGDRACTLPAPRGSVHE